MEIFADSVYTNGAIYTVDENRSWAEAVAIKDGKFIYVGSSHGVQSFIAEATEVIDLNKKMVMPGLHDMHIHGVEGALSALFSCTIPYTSSAKEIVELVRDYAHETPDREWIVGDAWMMRISPDIHKNLLDAVAPDRPVFLWDASHHNAWVNSKALALAGIYNNTPNPEGGEFVRDTNGDLTGLLLENAATELYQIIPSPSHEQTIEAIHWLAHMLNGLGVTSIKEAATNRAMLTAYKAVNDSQELNLRVGCHLLWITPFAYDVSDMEALVNDRHQYAGERVKVDFLKLFLDGVPIAKTAAVLEPYLPNSETDNHDSYAQLLVNPETLKEVLIRFDAEGFIVKMHATGDASLRVALDAIEAARKTNGYSSLGHEISHPQMIHPDDLPRFKQLEAVPDFCPIMWHPTANDELKISILGEERVEAFWPIGSLVRSGIRGIAGTDWPAMVPNANNWPGIEAMVTRQDPSGQTAGTLGENEHIDLADAIAIYTINGAHALRQADVTGSIEIGKYADMIILDRNLFEIPLSSIGETTVLKTILEGQTVFTHVDSKI